MMARKPGEEEGVPLDLVGRRAWVPRGVRPGRDGYPGGLLAPRAAARPPPPRANGGAAAGHETTHN